MTLLRAVLLFAMTFALVGFPVLVHGFGPPGGAAPAYAAGPLFQDNDNNDNNDNGDNDNDGDADNDNDENDNEGNGGGGGTPQQVTAPTNRVSTVVLAGQPGQLQLGLPAGIIAVTVVPEAPLPSGVTITLAEVNPGLIPPTPGARLDDIIFSLTADTGAALPGEVNLGITYVDPLGLNVADLTIGLYDRTQWVEAPKQAQAPANNYLSASVTRTGTYAVYQR